MSDNAVPAEQAPVPELESSLPQDAADFAKFEQSVNAEAGEEPPVDNATNAEEDAQDDGKDEDKDKEEQPKEEPSSEERRNRKPAARRIAELTARLRQAESQLEETAAQLQALAKPNGKTPDPTEPKKPNPADYELGVLDEGYLEARDEWRDALREHRQKQAEAEQQAALQAQYAAEQQRAALLAYEEKIVLGEEAYPDFVDKVVGGAERGEWDLSDTGLAFLLESEVGEHLSYYLATHPKEAKEIASLSPLRQAHRLGTLEAKFLGQDGRDAGSSAVVQPKPTKAALPAPIKTPRGSGGTFTSAVEATDFAAFEKAVMRRNR